jgi:hypothetical protein
VRALDRAVFVSDARIVARWLTSQGTPAAQILFGKGQPLEDQPVIESLTKIAKVTFQAIEALELFWFGNL